MRRARRDWGNGALVGTVVAMAVVMAILAYGLTRTSDQHGGWCEHQLKPCICFSVSSICFTSCAVATEGCLTPMSHENYSTHCAMASRAIKSVASLNMKPTRLANMLIRAAVRDKLVGAIIDAPARKPVPRRAPTPTVSMMMAPQLVGQFTDVVFDVAPGESN
jgi:hypothetical protein